MTAVLARLNVSKVGYEKKILETKLNAAEDCGGYICRNPKTGKVLYLEPMPRNHIETLFIEMTIEGEYFCMI